MVTERTTERELEQVREFAAHGARVIPVYRELPADIETPVLAFLKLTREKKPGWSPSFLLESVEGGERIGRYSFVGVGSEWGFELPATGGWIEHFPERRLKHTTPHVVDPLSFIETWLYEKGEIAGVTGIPRFYGGFVGFIGFECVGAFEDTLAGRANKDTIGIPDAFLFQVNDLLVFDHVYQKVKVITNMHVSASSDIERAYRDATSRIEEMVGKLSDPLDPKILSSHKLTYPSFEGHSNFEKAEYEAVVDRAKRYIVEGDIFQVVTSQRFSRETQAPPFKIYRTLRQVNPSPFMFYLDAGQFQLIGASPELLVKVEGGKVTTWPIAGTRPRGATPEEDLALENDLVTDEKERAEHTMLLDLGRNDIGRVTKPGTVRVERQMVVERFSNVMHMTSEVSGELREDMHPLDPLRACFPAGTVSGAPKIRAIEIIFGEENERRGPYAGALGFSSWSGDPTEWAIIIRTMVYKKGTVYNQAGGGIVYDSVPETEYNETLAKARAGQVALTRAEQEKF